MTQKNHTAGCQPMTCEGNPKHEGAQGVNGRGTQPLNLCGWCLKCAFHCRCWQLPPNPHGGMCLECFPLGDYTWDGLPVSTEAHT